MEAANERLGTPSWRVRTANGDEVCVCGVYMWESEWKVLDLEEKKYYAEEDMQGRCCERVRCGGEFTTAVSLLGVKYDTSAAYLKSTCLGSVPVVST